MSTFDDSNLMQSAGSMNLDEIDVALIKCQQDQGSLRNYGVQKLRKGVYKIEKKEF